MILSKLDVFHVQLRCRKPFKIATGVSDCCHTLVVRITCDNGVSGYGEAVPKPVLTGETLAGCEEAINNLLWPIIKDRDAWELNTLDEAMVKAAPGSPSARAAINIALNDILAKTTKLPLHIFLGSKRNSVETNYSIGLCSIEETAQEGRSIVQAGFHSIKLKVGLDPLEDAQRVHALRQAVGPDIRIRIDANEGWNYSSALKALQTMEADDVELVEQPLPRWNLKDMARLRQRISIPIIADESVRTPQDALNIILQEAADGFNIKLMKSGGLQVAMQIAHLARAAGMSLMIGGMVGESAIAVSAAVALAASHSFEYIDLDADLLLRDNLCPQAGLVTGPERCLDSTLPGLGIPAVADIYFASSLHRSLKADGYEHWDNT